MNATPLGAPAPAVESLSVITYQQQPVITTDLLAKLYGTGPDNIHDNFRKNADRFVDGKHFIKLEGEALREFKKSLTGSNPVSEIPRQARHFILWTERGAARHAKMLDTEQAWEVFEKLEDCYFSVKATPTSPIGDALKASIAEAVKQAIAAQMLPAPAQQPPALPAPTLPYPPEMSGPPRALELPPNRVIRGKDCRIAARAFDLSHQAFQIYCAQMHADPKIDRGIVLIEHWLPNTGQKMSIDPRRLIDLMTDLRKIYARLDALGIVASDLPPQWWDQHAVHGIGEPVSRG